METKMTSVDCQSPPIIDRPQRRSSFAAAIIVAARAALASALRFRRRKRSLIHLSQLDDRQLDDIGVTRGEVERVLAENRIYRDPVNPHQPH